MIDFEPFPKIARLIRDCVVTEKIDGTNGQIYIEDDGTTMHVGSRNKWLDEKNDNYGFFKWAQFLVKADLLKLGPGRHYGEWWGSGIQRGYGLPKGEKRFSLFNVGRWNAENTPDSVGVVPVLFQGQFDTLSIDAVLYDLEKEGSRAAPGFMDPEGICIYHTASMTTFKRTIKNGASPKGAIE